MTHEQIEHNKKVSDEFTKKITQLSPWFEEPYIKKTYHAYECLEL